MSRSDPDAVLATPVETVAAGPDAVGRIAALVEEAAAFEVVAGLPVSLSGCEGPAAGKVREFALRLAERIAPVPVRLCDERLSTVSAEATLRERGKKGRKRRAVVDQVAAVVILQHALDTERASGRPPGEVVELPEVPADSGEDRAT